jgi:hypothetical protein
MNRNWNILCWNIRGINNKEKWDALRNKIEESACAIVCIQETKKEHFDTPYIRQFAPKKFDKFDFCQSVGASWGILVLWNSSLFTGTVIDKQPFGITISFVSNHTSESWVLTTVYGPCLEPARTDFVNWMKTFRFRMRTTGSSWGISTSTVPWIIETNRGAICKTLLFSMISLVSWV